MSKFELLANKTSRGSALTVDGQSVQNVASAELTVAAGEVVRLVVTQTFVQGTASGEAEVTFVRRLLNGQEGTGSSPQEPSVVWTDELLALAREAAEGGHDRVGLGWYRLEDGRRVRYLYFIPQEVATAQESGDWGGLG